MDELKIFDIEVLRFEFVDITEDATQYNGAVFTIESLKGFDGKCVEITHDWKIRIWSDEGEIETEFFLIENDEFRRKLYLLYPM